MKKMLAFFLAVAAPMLGQATNPQNTFPNAVQSDSPSFWLNYNDLTSSFKDSVSGLTMGNSGTQNISIGTSTAPSSANNSTESIIVQSVALSSGTLSQVTFQYKTAPSSGQSVTIVILSGTYPSLTIVNSFSVTAAATTALQTFTGGGINFPTIVVTAGERIGFWTASGASPGGVSGGTQYYLGGQATLPAGAQTYNSYAGAVPALSATVADTYTSGTVTTQQPGFDYTNNAQFSAGFPYTGFSVAPNNTLGAVDWSTPWSMVWQIDRLNWNRTGTLVLASKGDISSTSNNWWKLTLHMSGYYAQLCFLANGSGLNGQTQGVCTPSSIDVGPNGFGYNIVVTNSGTGGNGVAAGTTNAFQIYVNGLNESSNAAPYGTGFGGVSFIVTGGTGYANTTAFTSSGGGANCNVAGTMNSTSGVPASFTIAAAQPNYGCTSNPTINLTSPTGVGATITATPIPVSINSTSYPVMAPGDVSAGVYNGIDGTDSTQTPSYIDEFAEFPGVLTASQIANLFYTTKWYQGFAPIPANPPVVILSEDGCGDTDDTFSLLMLIRAQQAGLITLGGVESTILDGTSQAYYRQALDQAGLNNVPVAAETGTAVGAGNCTSANITSYNASTPETAASYETSSTMYRTIFAKYPSTPIYIANGGPLDGIAQFMASPADGISSLTGAQLWARNGSNGGFLAVQGLGCCGTFGNYYTYPASQTVLTGNGTTPIYGWNSTPQSGGPGILASRTSNDPSWLLFNSLGSDSRSCGDCLTVVHAMFPGTNPFGGGVTLAIGGSGTGYAASTPFTSTGGGTNCHVSGFMLSTGGVPSSIVGTGGQPNTTPYGIGYGCYNPSSPPTINLVGATGTGATLTASTSDTSTCEGITQTASGNGATVTTPCTNFYTEWPQYNTVSGTPLFQWFINSLIDLVPVGQPRVP